MSEAEIVMKFISYGFLTFNVVIVCDAAETIVRKIIEYLERRDKWYEKT